MPLLDLMMTEIEGSLSCEQSFKEMVAKCLVKDQTKRPTAEKLLKHSFFKHATPPGLSVNELFTDLPPLWNRVRDLQHKDAAQLALKKMPSTEKEAISQSEYQRGVSAWNFDIEDLKAQASQVQDDDEIQEIGEEDESTESFVNPTDASNSRCTLRRSKYTNGIVFRFSEKVRGDEVTPVECLSKKEKVLETNDLVDFDNQWKNDLHKNGSKNEPSTSEKEAVQAQFGTPTEKSHRPLSGPLMPGVILSHSMSERGHILERCDIDKQTHCDIRRVPSFSGPLMLPKRASGNSLSAPIKLSGIRDSSEDKSMANLVQIRGRFSVTSENVDLVKGSPLMKSASVGDWVFESKHMPIGDSLKEIGTSNVPASILVPYLQNLFQQTSIQQDLIMNLFNSLQPSEILDASQNGKLLPLPRSSENNGTSLVKCAVPLLKMLSLSDSACCCGGEEPNRTVDLVPFALLWFTTNRTVDLYCWKVETMVSEREHLLLTKISELQARMINLTYEL
ncbi:unnamed protein product [Ilex paraguariensis]|uniref:Uncharacterized protein n=1 Tax=Ilex paraguariensis TaxID=185542 RepID=A0ABC8RV97_9AQUA